MELVLGEINSPETVGTLEMDLSSSRHCVMGVVHAGLTSENEVTSLVGGETHTCTFSYREVFVFSQSQ